MTSVLYDIGLHLFVLASLPKVAYEMVFKKKYRKSFLPRLGLHFPAIDKEDKKLIWIHAVSLGETKAIAPLVKKLKQLPNSPKVLLTTATEMGHLEGKKSIPEADYHHFLPLDLPYLIRPIVRRVTPDLLILVESDFWLHFQDEAKRAGAKLLLVNGKLSLSSYERFRRFPFLARALFTPFDHLCLQGKLYNERFQNLLPTSAKINVTGNIKLDSQEFTPLFDRSSLKIAPQDLVITLGSTHAPEEKLFLDHFRELHDEFPHLKLLIVPRRPERFTTVSKLLEKMKIDFTTLSQGNGLKEKSVMLVDKMGVLRSCYSLSDIAFVGGSFVKKVGGHNILEPSFYSVPVLYGPYMHSQPDFLELMQSYQAGLPVTQKNLLPTLKTLLSNSRERQEIGARGKRLVEEGRGALAKTWDVVLSCLTR